MSIFKKKNTILSPCDGEIVELKNVKDELFSSGLLGYGFGIKPTQGEVFSPIDGVVTNAFDTGHAYSIEGDGIEVLVHIGIDTVELDGEGFSARVKQGDKIKRHSPLAYADLELITKKGYDTTTVVVIPTELKSPKLSLGNKKAGEIAIEYR
ncbi:MAG: PTS glucose transporter subunit IIA [Clostridia bacterium]|nr:PTS glucose transporter subunit IIA [Clostridia bacterium]